MTPRVGQRAGTRSPRSFDCPSISSSWAARNFAGIEKAGLDGVLPLGREEGAADGRAAPDPRAGVADERAGPVVVLERPKTGQEVARSGAHGRPHSSAASIMALMLATGEPGGMLLPS